MAAFSVNQVNQFYVVKSVKTSGHLTDADAVGSIAVQKSGDDIYFEYMSPGGIVRTDLIRSGHVLHKSYKKGSNSSAHDIQAYKLTLSSTTIMPGQSYVLRIKFNNFIGNSIMDNYWVYADVMGKVGMTASDFYKNLACSLARNLVREASRLIDVYLISDSNLVEVPIAGAKYKMEDGFEDTYTGVVIKEHVQTPKMRGCGGDDPVDFVVIPLTVKDSGGVDYTWGEVEAYTQTKAKFTGKNYKEATYVPNGVTIKEMEYFFMGERADQERMQGWPNIVPTEYLATGVYDEYDVISIHHYFDDEGTSVQKSEKDMTFVGDATPLSTLRGKLATAGIPFTQIGTTGDYK